MSATADSASSTSARSSSSSGVWRSALRLGMAEEAQGQPVDRVLHLLDQPRQRR
jgi:hypothetical protein